MFGPEFFPTPKPLIRRMLAKLKRDAHYYLDPSAGKGNIVEARSQQSLDRKQEREDNENQANRW